MAEEFQTTVQPVQDQQATPTGPLDLQEPSSGPAPLDLTSTVPIQVPSGVLQARADKYNLGLGNGALQRQQLYFDLTSGNEETARLNAVVKNQLQQKEIRNNIARAYTLAIPQGQTNSQDIENIYNLTDPQAQALNRNPKTFFEEEYAKQRLAQAFNRPETKPILDSAPPAETEAKVAFGQKVITLKEIAQRIHEEVEAEKDATSWAAWGWDFTKTMVPFRGWYRQQNVLAGGRNSSFLLGNNLADQATAYYSSADPVEAEKNLRAAVKQLKENNLLDAVNFSSYIAGATNFDTFLNNLFSVADFTIIPPKPLAATALGAYYLSKRGTKIAAEAAMDPAAAAAAVTTVVKDTIKSVATRDPKPAEVAAGTGDIPTSALILALEKIRDRADAVGRSGSFDKLTGELKSLTNPTELFTRDPTALSSERALRIQTILEKQAKGLVEGVFDKPLEIDRLITDSKSLQAALKVGYEHWESQFPHLSDGVLNVRPYTPVEVATAAEYTVKSRALAQLKDIIARQGKETAYVEFQIADQAATEAIAKLRQLGSTQPIVRGGLRNMKISEMVKRLGTAEAGTGEMEAARNAATKALQKIGEFTPAQRKTFAQARDLELELARTAKPSLEKEVTAVKGFGNVDYASIKLGRGSHGAVIELGHPHEAALFSSKDAAELWAKEIYKLPEYRIGQKGPGFYIEVFKPLDETHPSVMAALGVETKEAAHRGLTYSIEGRIRSPEYTLVQEAMSDRQVSSFGTSALSTAVKEVGQQISRVPRSFSPLQALGLRKGSRKDLTQFLEAERNYVPPGSTEVTPGRFAKSQGEFEQNWMTMHRRLPTDQETLAYWSYVQLNDLGYGARNLDIFKYKTREGWEMHDFGLLGQGPQKPTAFEGKFVPEIPRNVREDFGVLVIDEAGNLEYHRAYGGAPYTSTTPVRKEKTKGGFFKKDYAREYPELANPKVAASRETQQAVFDEYTNSGYKTVQMTHYSNEELKKTLGGLGKEVPNGDIDFVMSRKLDSAPMDYQQLPYRPGGHHVYTAPYYLRQPILREAAGVTRYYDDRNVHGFEDLDQARKFTKNYNTGRLMLLDMQKNPLSKVTDVEFDNFVKRNLPWSTDTFKRKFEDGSWDIDTPFYLTTANRSVETSHNLSALHPAGRFVKQADSELNMYKGFNLREAGERGDTLTTVANKGSIEHPDFEMQAAKMLDPFSTLQRSVNAAMRGRYLEDLKFKAAQRYVAEFGDLLDASPKQLNENPMRWLYEAKFLDNPLRMDEINAAKNVRRQTLEFLGMKTDGQKEHDAARMKFANLFFKPTGADETVDPWFQYSKTSIPQRIKNQVFDFNMGWNPAQLWLQASQVFHVLGIEGPARASNAGLAAIVTRLHRLYGDDPAMIEHTSQALAKLGWNPEHFKESYVALQRSGFSNIGREMADMGDFMAPNMIGAASGRLGEGMGAFNDVGRSFVKSGERFGRDTAWHAAYLRWRKANPLGQLTDDSVKEILSRASLLNGDMTRASSSTWQGGVAGVTTQFLGYQVRLFEQLTHGLGYDLGLGGKPGRLTAREKAGVFAVNSLMYGMPISVGAYTLGFPFADMVKQYLSSNGIDWQDSIYSRILVAGAPSEVLGLITGRTTNVGTRYGPGGTTFIKDLLPSSLGGNERAAVDYFLGASGSALRHAMLSLEPIAMWMLAPYGSDQTQYPLEWKHFDAIASNWSGYDKISKALIAMTTGNYMAKNGETIGKINMSEALLKLIADIGPEELDKVRNVREVSRHIKALQDREFTFVRDEYKTAIRAMQSNPPDDEAAHAAMTRMRAHIVVGGWTDAEKPKLFREVTRGLGTQVEQISAEFAKRSPERMREFINQIQRNKEALP